MCGICLVLSPVAAATPAPAEQQQPSSKVRVAVWLRISAAALRSAAPCQRERRNCALRSLCTCAQEAWLVSIADALRRRGPDHLGAAQVRGGAWLPECGGAAVALSIGQPPVHAPLTVRLQVQVGQALLDLAASLLQLRGDTPGVAPLVQDAARPLPQQQQQPHGSAGGSGPPRIQHLAAHQSALLYNGEVFGGPDVPPGRNDGAVLFNALLSAASADAAAAAAPAVLSRVEGPWAVLFWHAPSRTLWFGRDVLGACATLGCPCQPPGCPCQPPGRRPGCRGAVDLHFREVCCCSVRMCAQAAGACCCSGPRTPAHGSR